MNIYSKKLKLVISKGIHRRSNIPNGRWFDHFSWADKKAKFKAKIADIVGPMARIFNEEIRFFSSK